ncbi:MAG: alpha/beta fold hydrolase [Bacteroidales bacterium]
MFDQIRVYLRMLMINTYRFLLLRTGMFLIALLLMVSCSTYRANVIGEEGVYVYNMVKIGGVSQSVMIRGTNINNPVMLYLHGGPGYPLFPLDPSAPLGWDDQEERMMSRLEEEFTMVYWEQRGTGRSYSWQLPGDSMNVDRFVEDTRELVDYVTGLLGQEKVFLWGHSWGSNVGALYASRYPETLYAYMSTGQSVEPYKNERLCYNFVLEKALEDNNRRALRQLERVDTLPENYGVRDALLVRRWVYNYGGIVYNGSNERPYVDFPDVWRTLTAPQYSLIDKMNLVLRPYYSINQLWNPLKELDLTRDAPRIEVPVFFLVGRHDIIVSAKLAEAYFHMLDAPAGKTLVWFEKSAHRPYHEEPDKFLKVIKQQVRQVAVP